MAKAKIAAAKGEGKRVRARLTAHEVALIAELAESGMSYEEIAAKFEK